MARKARRGSARHRHDGCYNILQEERRSTFQMMLKLIATMLPLGDTPYVKSQTAGKAEIPHMGTSHIRVPALLGTVSGTGTCTSSSCTSYKEFCRFAAAHRGACKLLQPTIERWIPTGYPVPATSCVRPGRMQRSDCRELKCIRNTAVLCSAADWGVVRYRYVRGEALPWRAGQTELRHSANLPCLLLLLFVESIFHTELRQRQGAAAGFFGKNAQLLHRLAFRAIGNPHAAAQEADARPPLGQARPPGLTRAHFPEGTLPPPTAAVVRTCSRVPWVPLLLDSDWRLHISGLQLAGDAAYLGVHCQRRQGCSSPPSRSAQQPRTTTALACRQQPPRGAGKREEAGGRGSSGLGLAPRCLRGWGGRHMPRRSAQTEV